MHNRFPFYALLTLPTYLWLWDISLIDLSRPEYSTIKFETRNMLESILKYTIIIALWLPVLILIVKRERKYKALLLPMALSSGLFLAMIASQNVYPDSESEYTENGYQHRIEKWQDKNGIKIKHWKSRDSLATYQTHQHIEWELINDK